MIQELKEKVSLAAWNLDFYEFCQRAGFDPRHHHAKEKWDAFRKLSASLSCFDAATLEKIITEPAPQPPPEVVHPDGDNEARAGLFD